MNKIEHQTRIALKRLFSISAISAFSFFSCPVLAQVNSENLELEEVFVTAQRREQSLQEVPISITAFSATKLESFMITKAQDYLSMTPNVSFSEEGERGTRSIKIAVRGISNLGGVDVGSDAVSIFFNDVSLNVNAQGTASPLLHDIERIEVLRGPQGTYFGVNASGGALSIIPNKPSDEKYAEVSGGVGNYGAWDMGAIINMPVTDRFFMRAMAAYEETPGVVKNANPVGGDSSGDHKDVRLSLRWLPTDNLDVMVMVNYSRLDEGLQQLIPTGVLSENTKRLLRTTVPIDDGFGFYPENTDTANNSTMIAGIRVPEVFDTDLTFITGHLTYTADKFNIKSITGYTDTGITKFMDQDHISVRWARNEDEYTGESFSQELRIASNGEGNIDWVFGAIYLDSTGSFRRAIISDEDGFGPFAPGHFINRRHIVTEAESFAAFGDLTWRPAEHWSIAAGVRYSDDKYTESQTEVFNARPPNIVIPIPDTTGGDSSSAISPRISVNYNLNDDVTGYATISKGYRPSGVRLNPGVPEAPYEKETLWNYEIGVKGAPIDNRLQFSMSLFYMDWKNAQFNAGVFLQDENGEIFGITATQNTDATSKGFEFEMAALVTEDLTISGGVGYLDAKFDNNTLGRSSGVDVDLSGQRLPQAPKWTINAAANYSRPFGSGGMDWFAQLEWKYRSKAVSNLDSYVFLSFPQGTDPFPYLNPSWDVTSLRLGLENEKFSATAYVENVFDDNYYTGSLTGVHVGGILVHPHPRLYGIRFRYKF